MCEAEMKRERECMSEGKTKQDIKGAERLGMGREGKDKRRSGGVGGVEGVLADYPVHLAQLCRPTHSHQSGTPYLPEA